MKEIIPNSDQRQALSEIQDWYDSDRLFHEMHGPAGSGKTSTLKQAIKNMYNVGISAPTHKAKRQASRATGLQAETLHKILGLQPNVMLEEFDTKNVIFSNIGKQMMADFNTLVIDECGMINSPLKTMIKDVAAKYGTKVLFLGDANQLPPIEKDKEKQGRISEIFTDEDISHSELRIVERQKDGNPLLEVYADILSDINSQTDLFKKETNIFEGKGLEVFSDIKKFGPRLLELFSSSDYALDKDFFKLLCYSNDNVRSWNNYCRLQLVGGVRNSLKQGECLLSYYTVWDRQRREFVIQNSYEYQIEDAYQTAKQHKFQKTRYDISGTQLSVKDIDSGFVSSIFVINNTVGNLQTYQNIYLVLESEAKNEKDGETRKRKWSQFYQFKNEFFLLGDIKDSSGNVVIKKDLDFSYALTVHKSQGSTYTNVAVDEPDINKAFHSFDRNRLKYVALSRPTDRAIMNI